MKSCSVPVLPRSNQTSYADIPSSPGSPCGPGVSDPGEYNANGTDVSGWLLSSSKDEHNPVLSTSTLSDFAEADHDTFSQPTPPIAEPVPITRLTIPKLSVVKVCCSEYS